MSHGKEWKDGTRLLGRRGEDPTRKQRRCLWTLPSCLLNGQKRGKHKHRAFRGGWEGKAGWAHSRRHSALSEGGHASVCCRREGQRAGENTGLLQRERLQTQTHSPEQRAEETTALYAAPYHPASAQFSSKGWSPTEEQGQDGSSGGVVSK